jgi:hypothetical protein
MKNVVRNEWTEPVDGQAYAAIAMASETWRGGIYQAGTFLLVPRDVPRYRARREVQEKLAAEMERGDHRRSSTVAFMHRFGMPLVGWVRDLRR